MEQIPQEKLDAIKRNFHRLCDACKLTDAFMVFHYSNEYHGIMLYCKNALAPCQIVVRLFAANDKVLKQASGHDLKNFNLN